MSRLLSVLATSLLVSGLFFFGNTTPVYAADGDTVIADGRVYSTDSDIPHAADALEADGKYQTYIAPSGAVVTMRLYMEADDFSMDDGIVDSFQIELRNGSFGANYTSNRVTDGDCALSWTNTSTTDRTGNINCDEDGADVHQIGVDFNITMPAAGPMVLYVSGVGSAFKVYFLVQETADNIYVGPGSIANGAGNCTTPDFTTNDSAQGFDDQEAIDAALQSIDDDGDTVVLCEHRYEYTDDIREYDGDDLYDGVLTIENESGVDASDIVLDGNSNYNLLNVTDASLDVTGLKFLDADVNDGGAAIFLDNGALGVADSIFNSNNADGSGGAIKASISDASGIATSTFVNNDSGFRGGAVNVNSATSNTEVFVMDGNVFEGNSADDDGGALRTGHNVMLDITDSEFTGNHSSNDYGGAIYANDDATIGYSVFTENVAYDDGGAVFFDEQAVINSSVFTRNEAGVNSGDDGGAIYGESWVQVFDSTFTSNFAGDEGGAMYADGLAVVLNSRFINNRSVEWAGAASFAESAWVWDTVFRGNKSRLGGAINSFGERLYLTRSKFINNQATQWGGAIARGFDRPSELGETYGEFRATLVGDVDRTTTFRANRSSVGLPVALYYTQTEGQRLAARQAVHVWNDAGAQSHIVRKVHQFNYNNGR